jgi:phosphotransferase system HPr (HPr) family protein
MISTRILVAWREGLHLRAAAQLVRLAHELDSSILLRSGSRVAAASNIMELMLLSAGPGTLLMIVADGGDEAGAIQSVTQFFSQPDAYDLDECASDSGDCGGNPLGSRPSSNAPQE